MLELSEKITASTFWKLWFVGPKLRRPHLFSAQINIYSNKRSHCDLCCLLWAPGRMVLLVRVSSVYQSEGRCGSHRRVFWVQNLVSNFREDLLTEEAPKDSLKQIPFMCLANGSANLKDISAEVFRYRLPKIQNRLPRRHRNFWKFLVCSLVNQMLNGVLNSLVLLPSEKGKHTAWEECYSWFPTFPSPLWEMRGLLCWWLIWADYFPG